MIYFDEKKEFIKDKRTKYCIIVPDNTTKVEQFASEELANYLFEITGAKLVINKESKMDVQNDYFIAIGNTNLKKKMCDLCKNIDFNRDGFVQKTVNNAIFLFGGEEERGHIYAVYDFLETVFGCRFFSIDCEKIPKIESINLPILDNVDVPDVGIRAVVYNTLLDGRFSCKSRLLTVFSPIDNDNEKFGKSLICYPEEKKSAYIWGSIHNINYILQYDKYGSIYPDWFKTDSGIPNFNPIYGVTDDGQYDTTMDVNPIDVAFETISKAILETDAYYFQCTQSDMSLCSSDVKYTERLSKLGYSGMYIQFLNLVCEKIDKWIKTATDKNGKQLFPNGRKYKILTFAYGTSQIPPINSEGKLNLNIHPNIFIWLAPIEFNCLYSYNDERQLKYVQNLIPSWKKCLKNVGIWDYYAGFCSYSTYFSPYLSTAYNNYLFYKENEITDLVFSQFSPCNSTPRNAFDEIKVYITSKMLWNVNRYNVNDLLKDYCEFVYGDCSNIVISVIKKLDDNFNNLQKCNGVCFVNHTTLNWVNYIPLTLLDETIEMIDGAIIINQNSSSPNKMIINTRLKYLKIMILSHKLLEYDSYYPINDKKRKKQFSDEFFDLLDEVSYDKYLSGDVTECIDNLKKHKVD